MFQTPLKPNLTLDLSSGFANFQNTGTSTSPSSPTTSYVASPVPSSPISGSWNVSKSQAELTQMLKEAYNVIREREKDLTLAAEIGKSLLENNIALKAKYEGAVVQLQHLQRERSKAQTFSIQHQAGDKHATQIAPPNNSLDTLSEDQLEFDESDTESLQGWSSSFEQSQQRGSSFNRKGHQNSGLNYKDLENIRDLEKRNQDLQQQLDEALKDLTDADKSNKAKLRKLEVELQHYQEACTSATQKIDELEKDNERLIQKQKEHFWNLKYSKKSDDDNDYIDSLLHKIQELEDQNYLLDKAKVEIERKLIQTVTESEAIREEYEELVETSKNYEELQLDNRNKEQLIAELSENLEEERALVVNYRSRGMWSQKTSRANSISGGGLSGALGRLSDPDRVNLFGMAQKPNGQESGGIGGKIRKTLLSELENEWFRELTIFQRDVKKGRGDSDVSSPNFTPISSEKDLHDFFIQNGARPDDEMDYLSDDEFSFLDEFDINDNEKANRLREWFWRRWARAIYRFLRTIWRWCRFVVILIAAVLMALYRGPDDILPNDM